MAHSLADAIHKACQTFQSLAAQQAIFDQLVAAAVTTLRSGGKILTCGNGGSAADALHLAEELVGRFARDRHPLPALALNADPTLLTCIGNDYGFEHVFARQVTALAEPRDLLVVFSSSGNSPNIVHALKAARERGCRSVALLGKTGGAARGLADIEWIVAGTDTARIQEAHTFILHSLLEAIERELGLG
ncbi:MAG: SIS domain-containing protein [Verrucomicrobiae bacterium]|nr:SIS domain-containing protein [Verrucomicrobiae bacterium]